MPNWVANTLRVEGPRADRLAFRERLIGRDEDALPLSFEALLPTPRRLRQGRYSDTAAGKRLVAAFDSGDTTAQRQLLENHPSLYFLASKLGERDGEGWYYWRLEHWGTKAEPIDVRVCSWRNTLNYDFFTAWSPPVAFVAAAARRFRTLSFEIVYHEPGNCFAGWRLYERGRLTGREDEDDTGAIVALLERHCCKEDAAMWRDLAGDEDAP